MRVALRAILPIMAVLAAASCFYHPVVAAEAETATGSATEATESPAVSEAAAELSVAELISQLSDRSFVLREAATRALEQRGIDARPMLIESLQHPNAEVRHRVRHILLNVLEEDFRQRIADFAAGHALAEDRQLPGWALFGELAGDDSAARRLYLKAVQAEPILLESVDQDSVYAAFAIRERANSLYTEIIRNPSLRGNSGRPGGASPHVAALLIAASNPAFEFDDQTAQKIFHMMQNSGFTQQLLPATNQVAARRLAGQFVRRSASTSIAYQTLWLSMQYGLEEGLIPAESILRRGERQPYVLQNAILAIGKLGGKSHLELLESLLDDATPVDKGRNTAGYQAQVRDVALAVTIHLHGQAPKSFGFAAIRAHAHTLFQPNTMGFRQQQLRDAAFAKWNKWVDEQQSADAQELDKP